MALFDDPTAQALNLPPPPQRMKWRLVREEQVRAIVVEIANEWCEEMMVRERLWYPQGTFNPLPIGESTEVLRSPYYKNVKDAEARLPDLSNYHPGFPEVIV